MSADLNENLFGAAGSGDLAGVTRTLRCGADVHAKRDLALRGAATKGHKDVVDLLLKHGADVHAVGDHALQMAAYNGHTAAVDLLLKAGANIHAGENLALLWAARNGHIEVVDRLIQSGADITELLQTDLRRETIVTILRQCASTAHRGYEAVMLLKPTPRMAVLRHLHPDMKPKQIRDELAMMTALGLSPAQMGEMWQSSHMAAPKNPEVAVSL